MPQSFATLDDDPADIPDVRELPSGRATLVYDSRDPDSPEFTAENLDALISRIEQWGCRADEALTRRNNANQPTLGDVA